MTGISASKLAELRAVISKLIADEEEDRQADASSYEEPYVRGLHTALALIDCAAEGTIKEST